MNMFVRLSHMCAHFLARAMHKGAWRLSRFDEDYLALTPSRLQAVPDGSLVFIHIDIRHMPLSRVAQLRDVVWKMVDATKAKSKFVILPTSGKDDFQIHAVPMDDESLAKLGLQRIPTAVQAEEVAA